MEVFLSWEEFQGNHNVLKPYLHYLSLGDLHANWGNRFAFWSYGDIHWQICSFVTFHSSLVRIDTCKVACWRQISCHVSFSNSTIQHVLHWALIQGSLWGTRISFFHQRIGASCTSIFGITRELPIFIMFGGNFFLSSFSYSFWANLAFMIVIIIIYLYFHWCVCKKKESMFRKNRERGVKEYKC